VAQLRQCAAANQDKFKTIWNQPGPQTQEQQAITTYCIGLKI
jgi:hypothetical protein